MKKIGRKKRKVTNPKRFVRPVEAPEIFKPKEVEVPQGDQVGVPVEIPNTNVPGAEPWPYTAR